MLHAAPRAACLALALLTASAALRPRTVYDVTASGIFPDDGVDDTAKLKSLLAGVPDGSTIHFPPGIYDFSSDAVHTDQIVLDTRSNITLEGDTSQASRLRFADRLARGLYLGNCSGITVRDLVLEYKDRPFTQGTVVAVESNLQYSGSRALKINVPSDSNLYRLPLPSDDALLYDHATEVAVYEPASRRVKTDTDQWYLTDAPHPLFDQNGLSGRDVRVHLKDNDDVSRIQALDLVIVKAITCHGLVVNHCSDTKFQRVTSRRMTCFAFFDVDGTHSSYDHCVADAPGDDLLSSAADGLHVNSHRGELTITGNSFDRTGDDAITSTTQEFKVVELVDGTSLLTLTTIGDQLTILPGDVFEFYDPSSFAPLPQRTVTGVHGPWWNSSANRLEWSVSFDTDTGAAVDYPCVDLAFVTGPTVVDGNTIRRHRARGMLFKVSNLTITNNDISGSTFAGMAFGPEFFYDSAAFVRNVTVDHNTISDVGTYTEGLQQSGAISVQVGVLWNGPLDVDDIARENKDIFIHHNVIKQTGGPAVLLTNVDHADVYENDLWSSLWNPSPQNPGDVGMGTADGAVHLDNCGDVDVYDNRIETTASAQACNALSTHLSSPWTFTGNQRVFHTGFESQHHAPNPPQSGGIPTVGSGHFYNISTPSWTATEDGRTLTFQKWGLFGLDPVFPFYIDRQTTQCNLHTGKLDVPFTATATGTLGIDFSLGANGLTNSWSLEAWILPPTGPPSSWIFLGQWHNTSNDLIATAPDPHWTRKSVNFPALTTGTNYKVRFIRVDQPGAQQSPYVYLDDVVVRLDMIPNQ